MLKVAESCNISPTRSSLITHAIVATKKHKGIQATIFIAPPKKPEFAAIQSNSVYLLSCNENEAFEEFLHASEKAVILTIPIYIAMLQFFRAKWPPMKENIEIQFAKIRKPDHPIELDPYIQFSLAATCSYEMAIEDALIGFQKCSDDSSPIMFYVNRNGKSVWLNADTMNKLADASVQTLVNTLYKAGYKDCNIQSEHD